MSFTLVSGLIPLAAIVANDVLPLLPDWLFTRTGDAAVSAQDTEVVYDGVQAQALKIVSKVPPASQRRSLLLAWSSRPSRYLEQVDRRVEGAANE